MSCESCRFAEPTEDSRLLECRRRPPVLLVGIDGGWKQGWPLVGKQHWCGEEEQARTPSPFTPTNPVNPSRPSERGRSSVD